ncbi:MAG: phosphoenolpyruvate--protein phosphotransferase [Planctomycetes bacterium]|nr:phosphoenolpyruvate--protein phosphotransferase [Planctomycetota bacterium]
MNQPYLLIRLGLEPRAKEDMVRYAVGLLAEAGCVPVDYAESMFRREKTANTFLGAGLAIPHGELADKGMVKRDGLCVLQVPKGIDWGKGNVATLVVAIAAASDAHTDILTRLAGIVTDEAALSRLNAATDTETIRLALTEEETGKTHEAAEDLSETMEWHVDYPAGLHARPASVWVERAKALGIPMRVRNGGKVADPRNLVALLKLGVKVGDTLVVSAEGPEARQVLERFRRDISALSAGEKTQAARAASKRTSVSVRAWAPPKTEIVDVVDGVPASPGLAIGTLHRLDPTVIEVPDQPEPLLAGGARREEALKITRNQLEAVVDDTARRLGEADAAIFKAQIVVLEDKELIAETCRHLVDGHGVAWSWHHAVNKQAKELAESGNALMAARAADLRDVGLRVLTNLSPELEIKKASLPEQGNAIIVAEDLSPSDTATIDTAKVIGLATVQGGPTSHTAILARTLGLAAVVAVGRGLLDIPDGTSAIIDGDGGRVWINPSEEALAAARAEMERRRSERAAQAERRALPAITKDGHHVEVAANINLAYQAPLAMEMGAEGVGLMRTEFLFLERSDTPSEDEQFEIYRDMARAMAGRRVIVRALDIGGDKQVPHLSLPVEANPFLGVRGARLLLRRTDLLEPQMRALYRVQKEYPSISVMFPMITSVSEVLELKAICERLRSELSAPFIPLGIMIEVPAAAAMADLLARHVDFFSIGTNDLTQYTLAMDRQNPDLAPETDALHPAVLRMIAGTVRGAAPFGRMVGVCGGIAGEPAGAILLAGLGVTELSMTPRDIPAVKDSVRCQSYAGLKELAAKALDMESPEQVRELLDSLLPTT